VTPDLAQQAGVLPYCQRQHDRKERCSKHVMLAIRKGKSCASQKGLGSQKILTFSPARRRRTEEPTEFRLSVPKIPQCGSAAGELFTQPERLKDFEAPRLDSQRARLAGTVVSLVDNLNRTPRRAS
jgi:hypothetical protein